MGMNSNLLIADDNIPSDADLGEINSREDAWAFIDARRGQELKLRVNLIGEDGYDFEYRDGAEIMIDRSVDSMTELYYEWEGQMPHLIDILNLIMRDFTNPDMCSDENIIEELMGRRWSRELENLDLSSEDLRVTKELLQDLARDMYNYIAYALTFCNIVEEEKVWEFLHVEDAHMRSGKLYIVARIYVEGLRDLDYMDERTDVDLVEIVNDIRDLFILSEESRAQRKIYDRDRSRGLAERLLS